MTFTHPNTWPVLPKDYRIVTTRQGVEKVAAVMPYPSLEGALCIGDDSYTDPAHKNVEDLAYRRAKCGRCPAMNACREWAVAHESWGLWGGTTAGERQAIRDERGQMMFEPMSAHEYGMGSDPLALWSRGDDGGEDQAN